jgi:hypothetical protein
MFVFQLSQTADMRKYLVSYSILQTTDTCTVAIDRILDRKLDLLTTYR